MYPREAVCILLARAASLLTPKESFSPTRMSRNIFSSLTAVYLVLFVRGVRLSTAIRRLSFIFHQHGSARMRRCSPRQNRAGLANTTSHFSLLPEVQRLRRFLLLFPPCLSRRIHFFPIHQSSSPPMARSFLKQARCSPLSFPRSSSAR